MGCRATRSPWCFLARLAVDKNRRGDEESVAWLLRGRHDPPRSRQPTRSESVARDACVHAIDGTARALSTYAMDSSRRRPDPLHLMILIKGHHRGAHRSDAGPTELLNHAWRSSPAATGVVGCSRHTLGAVDRGWPAGPSQLVLALACSGCRSDAR